jgi:hypothetical protein
MILKQIRVEIARLRSPEHTPAQAPDRPGNLMPPQFKESQR